MKQNCELEINNTSAGNFFLKQGYQDHLIDLKKSILRKDTGTMGIYTCKKKKSILTLQYMQKTQNESKI